MSKLGDMAGLFDMMKNAKQMMQKAKDAQDDLAKKTVVGTAGAGLATATMNGMGELIGLKFDKSVVDPEDPEMLADLVISAVADARKHVAELRGEMYAQLAGGVDLGALGIDKSVLF